MNVMPLFEQFDLALTLCANQFAGRSIALDKFVNHIAYLPLLNGGVFLAAFFWLWFEADETTLSLHFWGPSSSQVSRTF
jgi:hypothetical protein